MISLLFNRFSKVVLAMEIAGFAFMVAAIVRIALSPVGLLTETLAALVVFIYIFIRTCASLRWYKGVPRYSGIELQFKKALVPASYIQALAWAWCLIHPSAIPLAIAASMLAVIGHVNVILIYFHLRDRDPAPVNFYSSGRFLDQKPEAASSFCIYK